MIYLDNAATTKVSPKVMGAMFRCLESDYGNPGSIHSYGRTADKAVRHARTQVARVINANPNNIIFTSGGSEANSLAILGVADYLKKIGKTHIIVSSVEHKSVLECMRVMLCNVFDITIIDVDKDGRLPLESLADKLREDTGLVSIMHVNNETGNMYDIKHIGDLCKKRKVLLHTDCVQAYGHTKIDVEESSVDFLTASAHKIHGPKGVGFLYARNKKLLTPLVYGGGQEHGLRAGTENVPGIVGFGVAAEESFSNMSHEKSGYVRKMNDLKERVLREFPDIAHINGEPYDGARTINLRFDGVDGETLVLALNSNGVLVSAGAACSAHSAKASHVLTALGLSDQEAKGSIRISMSKYTTVGDVHKAAEQIIHCVKLLRA